MTTPQPNEKLMKMAEELDIHELDCGRGRQKSCDCETGELVKNVLLRIQTETEEKVRKEMVEVAEETNKVQSATFPSWDKPTAATLIFVLKREDDALSARGGEGKE